VSTLPPEIQVAFALVLAWEQTAKAGELPPMDVHAAALKIASYRAAHGDGQPRESAVDRFMRTARGDSPKEMPPWDAALIGDQAQPGERASDRFRRLRLANVKS
jgi:hypothetical protein